MSVQMRSQSPFWNVTSYLDRPARAGDPVVVGLIAGLGWPGRALDVGPDGWCRVENLLTRQQQLVPLAECRPVEVAEVDHNTEEVRL